MQVSVILHSWYGVQEPSDNEDKQQRRSIVPETNNTKREDNKVSDEAAVATEATCYDNKELKGLKVSGPDNSEIENDKVHGGFDAEEKQEKEEETDSNDDNNDDDDVAEVCTLFLVKM